MSQRQLIVHSLFSGSDSVFCSVHTLICIIPGFGSSLAVGWVREQGGKEESSFASSLRQRAVPGTVPGVLRHCRRDSLLLVMSPLCSAGKHNVPSPRAFREPAVPPGSGWREVGGTQVTGGRIESLVSFFSFHKALPISVLCFSTTNLLFMHLKCLGGRVPEK